MRLRVDMSAEILGLPLSDLKKMQRTIDRRNVLGCEKVHVRVDYDQVIAIPSVKLFQALEEEYEYQI